MPNYVDSRKIVDEFEININKTVDIQKRLQTK